jgi:hypothetical protein
MTRHSDRHMMNDILTCLPLDGTIDGERGGRNLLLVVPVHAPGPASSMSAGAAASRTPERHLGLGVNN